MENSDNLLKDIIGKDEAIAQAAADYMINNTDKELFKMLVAKSDFLFDFIKNNVIKRIKKAVNKDNYKNIIEFFDLYSADYDDCFAQILAENADQNLTDDIFELLEKGTTEQKTYAAKYFSYIPDTIAIELLIKYAFSDDENLSYNSAEALGKMRDDISFDIALNTLESSDDFDKLKAVKFFTAYGNNYPLKEIFKAMKTSKMPENIAGQIPYMSALSGLLKSEYKYDTLIAISYIIDGLGEILPLSDIFQFELYEIIETFTKQNKVENEFSAEIANILLKSLAKFRLFIENQEYIFDETKEVKHEINSILNLLQGQNKEFWITQKKFVLAELQGTKEEIQSALPVIKEFNMQEAIPQLKELLASDDEILICEVLSTLKVLNALDGIDIKTIAERINNVNIKAIIENL